MQSQRSRQREQAADGLQALRIGQALARQRLERAHLRSGGGHAPDASRDRAQLADVAQRAVTQIDLRDADVIFIGSRQRTNRLPMALRTAQAGQRGRMGHIARSRVPWSDSIAASAAAVSGTSRCAGRIEAAKRSR